MKTRYWRSFPLCAFIVITILLRAGLVHSYFGDFMVGALVQPLMTR